MRPSELVASFDLRAEGAKFPPEQNDEQTMSQNVTLSAMRALLVLAGEAEGSGCDGRSYPLGPFITTCCGDLIDSVSSWAFLICGFVHSVHRWPILHFP